MIQSYRAGAAVDTLTADEHVTAIARFAQLGGTAVRLYDNLIGHVALTHAVDVIVTLDGRDLVPLFPHLRIVTPMAVLETP